MILAAALFAATAATDMHVIQVNDRRSKGPFSRLLLIVEVPSVKNADVAASRVLLKTAVDDAGNDLIASTEEPKLDANQHQGSKDDPGTPHPMTVYVEMKNPSRSAKAVKEVRGDIEFYIPTKDPNGTATIQKFMSQSGKSLSDRALRANGVDMSIISQAQFETMKKAASDKYRAEQKAAGAEGDDLEERVKNFLEYDYVKPDEGDVLVKLNDPQKRVESVSYIDAKGEMKQVNMRDKNGIFVLSTWGEKPQPDWAMRVNLKTSKNITRYPLVLTNVPLP